EGLPTKKRPHRIPNRRHPGRTSDQDHPIKIRGGELCVPERPPNHTLRALELRRDQLRQLSARKSKRGRFAVWSLKGDARAFSVRQLMFQATSRLKRDCDDLQRSVSAVPVAR